MATTELTVTMPGGQRLTAAQVLDPWQKRKEAALKARKPYETRWLENQAFAAGRHWVRVKEGREGRRILDVRETLKAQGWNPQEADVLTVRLWTAIGRLSADSYLPKFLTVRDTDREDDLYADGFNRAFQWGWEQEYHGDDTFDDVLLTLATYGLAGVRCRFDKTCGPLVGVLPHRDGKPIMDPQQARDATGEAHFYGESANLKPVHEGAIVLDSLTPWNMGWPPGVIDDRNFPWEFVFRPCHLDDVRQAYGQVSADLQAEPLEAMDVLGLREPGSSDPNDNPGPGRLEGHVLLCTGYLRPCMTHPYGQTVVFAGETLLDTEEKLPYSQAPWGPRSGVTYFKYWPVKQRFPGRALIEPGIGPQRTRNKRLTQIDQIIDRSMPRVWAEEGSFELPAGRAMEVSWLKPGTPPPKTDPGPGLNSHFGASIQQADGDIEEGMGLHGATVGETPAAGTPYAALAQAAENDATKLGPISTRLHAGIARVARDVGEAMRQWPDGKLMLIEGKDGLSLEQVVFERSQVPAAYMVKPAETSLPRSQAAEIQKINDVWQAALASQAVAQKSAEWLQWYVDSIDDGKLQDLPEMPTQLEQAHKAQLENVAMIHTGQPAPVAPYDDAQVHLPIHDQQLAELAEAAMYGVQEAQAATQAIEQHKQMHLQQAQQMAQNAPPTAPPLPLPPGVPQAGPTAGPPTPPTPGGQ